MRNKLTNILFAAILIMAAGGCDDILDRQPLNKLTEGVVFNSYESVKIYAWNLYEAFPAYDQRGWSNSDNLDGDRSTVQLRTGVRDCLMWGDYESDLMDMGSDNGESNWIWGRVDTPTSSYDYSAPYKNIRAINVMLDGITASAALSEEEKAHWIAVGHFFRAYNHASLLNRYGDIIYVDKLLTDQSPELYSERMPRDEVADKILQELFSARDNIGSYNDGSCTVNRDVINAFISRFGLMEGTWRKYHNLGSAETYLNASVAASEELLPKYPKLHPNYDEVFNSESLDGVDGIILFKSYVEKQTVNRLSTEIRNDNDGEDLTKKAVDMYLCTDGKTRWTSKLFEGDKTLHQELRNRDKRLYYTIIPPYKVNVDKSGYNYSLTGDPLDEEYIHLMNELSDDKHKTLPARQWTEKIAGTYPNLYRNKTANWCHSGTGYRLWKFYNRTAGAINNQDIADAPIFRIEEVMLNYAEATFELGKFDQDICNKTINKLRERGGIPSLTIGQEPEDPTRDASVPATLWEIRRERAIELMAEGFRFDDLRRWKKCDYMNEQKLGMWIKQSDYPRMPIQDGKSEGYIALDGKPSGFLEYYYLQAIPTDERILNKNLSQNPQWVE